MKLKLFFLHEWPKILLFVLIGFFLMVPGRQGWLDGLPLSQLHELFGLFIVGILWFFLPISANNLRDKKIHKLFISLIIIKVALGFFSLPQGLIGTYHVQGEDHIFSTEFKDEFEEKGIQATRIDQSINFRDFGAYDLNSKPFPLWFLNDLSFNNVERLEIPFWAEWEGYIYLPSSLPFSSVLTVRTTEEVVISLEGTEIISTNNFTGSTPGAGYFYYALPPQEDRLVPIKIYYNDPGDDFSRDFRIYYMENYQLQDPLAIFFYNNYSVERIHIDQVVGWIDALNKLLFIAVLFLIMKIIPEVQWKNWIHSNSSRLFTVVFFFSIFSFFHLLKEVGGSPVFNLLNGGNDDLAYEAFARSMQYSHDWMNTITQTGVYYYQVLYYYLIAISHRFLTGESLFPLTFLQVVVFIIDGVLVYQLGRLLIKKESWVLYIALAAIMLNPVLLKSSFVLFPVGTFWIIITSLLLFVGKNKFGKNENYLVPFLFAGIFMGLGMVMRINFAPWAFFIVLWFILRFRRKFILISGIFLLGISLALSPFVLRNVVVAHEVTLNTGGAENFILSYSGIVPVDYQPKEYHALSSFISSDTRAVRILEYIIENPKWYFETLKGRFITITRYNYEYANFHYYIFMPLALFGLFSILFWISPKIFSKHLERKDYFVYGGFIISQLITLTLISSQYQMRYIYPLIPFALLFSSFLLIPLYELVCRLNSGKK